MGKAWLRDRRRDGYYRMAKRLNYRSRASFKIFQIDDRYRIFRPGGLVVDLGASPGGWSQAAAERVAPNGLVVAVDTATMAPLERVTVLRGDVRSEETRRDILGALAGRHPNVVLSDMSPNLAGNASLDQSRSAELAQSALDVARSLLRSRGHLVVKIFQGEDFPEFLRQVRADFRFTKAHSPKASRSASSEIYIVAKGYRGPPGDDSEESASEE